MDRSRKMHSKSAISQRVNKKYQETHLNLRIVTNGLKIEPTDRYELKALADIRTTLNKTKDRLDPIYIRTGTDKQYKGKWLQLNSIVDIYKQMRFKIQHETAAKHVTNAWLKYWEIYAHYDLIKPAMDNNSPQGQFRAFFNAELPGAALCAFNHYCKTTGFDQKPNFDFDWRASSLAPDDTIQSLGDVYGLYKHNQDKWLMDIGAIRHNNGDATVVQNLEDFEKRVGPASPWGGVDLYSHDAGISVSGTTDSQLDFNQQELLNAKIHLGCAIAGFMTLKLGGCFIAKQYTFFETITWNLILIYAQMFDEFYISKPLASRPYNSEIYLIGKGFRGFPSEIRAALINRLENFDTTPLITLAAATPYLPDLVKFAHTVFYQQNTFIEENIWLFRLYQNNLNGLDQAIKPIKAERIAAWLKAYPVKRIKPEDQLPSD